MKQAGIIYQGLSILENPVCAYLTVGAVLFGCGRFSKETASAKSETVGEKAAMPEPELAAEHAPAAGVAA